MRILLNKEIMVMTFNEALKEINELSFTTDNGDSWVNSYTSVYALIQELQEEYAPTIEMTKNQYLFITSEYEKESVVDAVANLTADNIIKEEFHSNFWSPLSEKQVVQAWLHPEMINVVE